MAWRFDPFGPLYAPSPAAVSTVVETDRESRMSWEITWSEDGDVLARDIVDMRTGLLVEPGRGGPFLTDVGPIDSLPAAFPGVFPDDVEVDRDFNNMFGQRAVTLDEAASEFAPGLIVPSDLPADAAAFVYDAALGRQDPRREAVTIFARDGLDTTQIVVSKFLPHDNVTITAGDVACYDVDQDQVCDYRIHGVDTVEAGALAGRDLAVIHGVVTVYDAGRTIEITNVDPQHTLEIANSFIAAEVHAAP
jgi:hypothetical protein